MRIPVVGFCGSVSLLGTALLYVETHHRLPGAPPGRAHVLSSRRSRDCLKTASDTSLRVAGPGPEELRRGANPPGV